MPNYFQMGDEPFFYINTGNDAVPVWTEVDNAEEILVDLQKNESERKPRVSPFVLTRGAKKTAPISFKYSSTIAADTIRNQLWDSFVNNTPVQFAWTTLAITDNAAMGLKAWCEVMKFPLPANDEEGVMFDVEAKPTDYEEGGSLILPVLVEPA